MKHPRRLETHESEGRGGGGAEKAAETEEAKMAVGRGSEFDSEGEAGEDNINKG